MTCIRACPVYIYSNPYSPFLLHNSNPHKGSREESSQEQKDSEEGTHLQDAQKSGKAPPSSGTHDSGINALSYSVDESSTRRPSTPTLVFPLPQRSLPLLLPTAPNEAAYNETPGSTNTPVSSSTESQVCGVATSHLTLPADRYVVERLRNLTLDGKQMEALKEENQQLTKKVQQNEEALKNLKDEIEKMNITKCQEIKNVENIEIRNEGELDQLKSHVAELQKKLEEKTLELQKSLNESIAHVMQVQFHEQKVQDLKKELSEEKDKVEIKEKEIINLKDKIRDMEIDKIKLSADYKEKIHVLEKEREVLKTKLEMGAQVEAKEKENCCLRLKLEMAEKNQIIQGELEMERNLRRVAEQEKEEVVRKLEASEDEVRDLRSQLMKRKSSWWF